MQNEYCRQVEMELQDIPTSLDISSRRRNDGDEKHISSTENEEQIPTKQDSDDQSPIEQVALTVPTTDDPTIPVLTFRMWVLGILSCVLLSFLNQFFWYRTEPFTISAIAAQIAVLPLGRLMAATITKKKFFAGSRWEFSLNPGPFNRKEHVLITIFANAGAGTVYAIHIVTIVKIFYKKNLSFFVSLLVCMTTQILGFGWAGVFRKYLVEPAAMWWPDSGMHGLGIGAISIDWSTISAYLGSPLASPWFATANMAVGFFLVMYVITPLTYWFNLYNAKTFPIFSSTLFNSAGDRYNVSGIVDSNFHLDVAAYEKYGGIHLTTFFAITEIWHLSLSALRDREVDVHTRLMRKYKQVPEFWFVGILVGTIALAIFSCEYYNEQLQLRWWGVILACGIALFFTLPIGVVTATTNQTPGLNIITEYMIGYLNPGRPVANVCFKTYGYISMGQALSFLMDLKLGHYMKIPPRAMFWAQFVGTVISGIVYIGTAWWLIHSIENICDTALLPPGSPWTCPTDRVFYDASVIWGLVGPRRIFGNLGEYGAINWFFLAGAIAPVIVWLFHKAFPQNEWIRLIYMPVLIGATAWMPAATAVNYTSWFLMGFIFNFVLYRYKKDWWKRRNYVISAAFDGGLAFMAVLLYFCLGYKKNISLNWWGANVDGCSLLS
eukprot:PITA_15850